MSSRSSAMAYSASTSNKSVKIRFSNDVICSIVGEPHLKLKNLEENSFS